MAPFLVASLMLMSVCSIQGHSLMFWLGTSASTVAPSDASTQYSELEDDYPEEENGEVDEDIIIEDDVDTNDDEGINN